MHSFAAFLLDPAEFNPLLRVFRSERGGHSSSNRFDLHSNDSGKSPSNAHACTVLPPFCLIQPSSIHSCAFSDRNAAAIPVQTGLICTRMILANRLQTPTHAQFCRLFA